MKSVFFDFDGVIHDTFEFHRKKIKEFTNIKLSKKDYRDVHRKNFFLNIPEEFKSIDWGDYTNFVYNDLVNLKINNDIRRSILEMSEKHKLYIVSSAGTKNVVKYLENNGVLDVFKEILGMEPLRLKKDKFKYLFQKYNLLPKDCIFITDTLGDIIEANEVDLPTIAVDFGFHPREILEEGRPYKIISSFDDIIKYI